MKQIGLNLSLVLFLLAPALLVAQPTDIFISEYIEGSSNNKAIEFYNGTGAPINSCRMGTMFFRCTTMAIHQQGLRLA